MALSYLEDFDSQIPAIQLLNALKLQGERIADDRSSDDSQSDKFHNLGWEYLSRNDALELRNNRKSQVVLTGILRPWLEQNNPIQVKGETHPFTDSNIHEAIRRLVDEPYDGLVRTNEKIYHLLTLGTSLDQTIAGDRKGRSLKYIDWQHPENNVYHITDEFSVERRQTHDTRRPDLVLFVNGIPFVVIECKRRDKDTHSGDKQIDKAVKQIITYQRDDEIPHLFQYAQLVMATSVNDILYATTGTPRKFWGVWREGGEHADEVYRTVSTRMPSNVENKIFTPLEEKDASAYLQAQEYFTELWQEGDRLPTAQDQTLWAMLRPERLIELIYGYIVFDAGVRKIARYQQYFAVKETMQRVSVLHEGRRTGGVIWHTTGSGKSLTMVMLAKALALHPDISNPRVVLVTDRIDLDDQIWETFEACGKTAIRAKTGEHLVRLIKEAKASVITTVIDKFDTVMTKHGVNDSSPNIFILVDEGHRSNYSSIAAKMRRVFSNGCFIGFTGTPLLKKDKNTSRKFGGIIHSYPLRQATVEDHAVTPLLYEGRIANLEQNKDAMQAWFERLTENLTKDQKADLKRKMTSKEMIHKIDQRIALVAYDISKHYRDNFQGTGFKGQLATDSRTSAIVYRNYINEYAMVNCEVIMSKPDTRETGDTIEEEDLPLVNRFWKEMMERFGNEEDYVKQIKASFGREDGAEILIVVSKLLTGFDEPRNTVLYIDKKLEGHNILQAIARVNRLFTGKEYGYIIDYRGVLGSLNEALKTYDALAEFDAEDVELEGAITDTHEEVAKLPQLHSDLWDVFKDVKNKHDNESMEQSLALDDRRQEFYEALTKYQKVLSVALSTEHFYDDSPKERIEKYKEDLKNFRSLRASVQQRYAEIIDFSQYEKQIRKVMDSHIQASDIGIVTELVNIFDTKSFDEEVEKREGKAAKADIIANRVMKTITEKMEEDVVFYKKFADLIQLAIEDYRNNRIDESEYLKRVTDCMETIRRGHDKDIPIKLEGHQEAQAYYGIFNELFSSPDQDLKVAEEAAVYQVENMTLVPELVANIALDIEGIIAKRKIRDWAHNEDVISGIKNDIDDYLFDIRDDETLTISTDDMDLVMERCINVARKLAGL
ncbi:MAG: HsdR family type I site-specific deoxyribonuclease [Methylococcales bacterium]